MMQQPMATTAKTGVPLKDGGKPHHISGFDVPTRRQMYATAAEVQSKPQLEATSNHHTHHANSNVKQSQGGVPSYLVDHQSRTSENISNHEIQINSGVNKEQQITDGQTYE